MLLSGPTNLLGMVVIIPDIMVTVMPHYVISQACKKGCCLLFATDLIGLTHFGLEDMWQSIPVSIVYQQIVRKMFCVPLVRLSAEHGHR